MQKKMQIQDFKVNAKRVQTVMFGYSTIQQTIRDPMPKGSRAPRNYDYDDNYHNTSNYTKVK